MFRVFACPADWLRLSNPASCLRIQARCGRGSGIAFEITKPDHAHAAGGVRTEVEAQIDASSILS